MQIEFTLGECHQSFSHSVTYCLKMTLHILYQRKFHLISHPVIQCHGVPFVFSHSCHYFLLSHYSFFSFFSTSFYFPSFYRHSVIIPCFQRYSTLIKQISLNYLYIQSAGRSGEKSTAFNGKLSSLWVQFWQDKRACACSEAFGGSFNLRKAMQCQTSQQPLRNTSSELRSLITGLCYLWNQRSTFITGLQIPQFRV